MDYLKQIRQEFPEIVAHEEDDDDWEQEGFDFIKKNNFIEAEKIFKKLCLSQPLHHGGFEGLAYTYYLTNAKDKAKWFMEKSLELARSFLEDDSIDIEVIEEMEENYRRILNNKALIGWWK